MEVLERNEDTEIPGKGWKRLLLPTPFGRARVAF
jgi:hypothetical protein